MNQKNIRDFNGVEFSIAEAAEWHKEFNNRTKSAQVGYNSIDELGTKVKALELAASKLGIADVLGLETALNSKEKAFSKNTAFNKNFGTSAGTVAQGNDSRMNNGQTAYAWGNHAKVGYLTSLPSHSHSWGVITGKPSTFSPSTHNHDDRYYTEAESNLRFVRYGAGSYSLLLGKNGSTSDWLRTTSNGILPYESGGSGSIGTSSWNFNTIYGKTLYENNVALSSKYLGKTAKAVDSDKLDGIHGTSFLRSDANDAFTGMFSVGSTGKRSAGLYGVYDSYKTAHIWSMGTAYKIPDSGANFGNLCGLAYKHTNNKTGGTMAGGHQMVWCESGVPKAALGSSGIWSGGNIYATSGLISGLRFASGYDAKTSNSFSCSNWFRSNGNTGWYNATYGAGIYAVRAGEVLTYNGSNLGFTGAGRIRRYSHTAGFLEGSYNTVGDNGNKTNPIYIIGSSYFPSESALGNMYGVGFAEGSRAGFLNSTDLGVNPAGWGLYVSADGNARIFLNATSGHGYFKGHIYANQGVFKGNVTGSSDRRLKADIKKIPNALEKVLQLNGCTWERTDLTLSQAGIIAQDLKKVLPVAVTEDEKGVLSVDQGNALSALLIEAVKELKEKIDGFTN